MTCMTTRREFINTAMAGLIAAGSVRTSSAAGMNDGMLRHPLSGGLGLQLYSLRHLFKTDVPGTLSMVKQWGITNVELAGTYGMSVSEFAALLAKNGLRPVSTHADFGKLATDIDPILQEAKTFGVQYLGCAWIPHKERFSAADAQKAAAVFNAAGKKAKDAGLRFFYHLHGYEFQQGPDGTLFDLIAKQTDPSAVSFEMDVFWAVHGGADPVKLFTMYPNRFVLTHLKDMKKGTKGDHTGHAPDDTNVPLGQGTIDWVSVLREANKQQVPFHFIEDEHPQSEKQIPQSLQYLANLKL
jgi:sugar phosphate isomerase/epimerase